MQEKSSQPQPRVEPVTIQVDDQGQVKASPETQTLYGGDSVQWEFELGDTDSVEIVFHEMTTPTGGRHRGPFPPRNDQHNPSEGVFKHRGKGNVLTLPARPPAHGFREERWQYDINLTSGSGEVAQADPLIIVRAR